MRILFAYLVFARVYTFSIWRTSPITFDQDDLGAKQWTRQCVVEYLSVDIWFFFQTLFFLNFPFTIRVCVWLWRFFNRNFIFRCWSMWESSSLCIWQSGRFCHKEINFQTCLQARFAKQAEKSNDFAFIYLFYPLIKLLFECLDAKTHRIE